MGKYDDIINMKHFVSKKYPQMSMKDRAAQFSPFAALTGYDAAIKETARLTDRRVDLNDDMLQKLDEKMCNQKEIRFSAKVQSCNFLF